jgi:hypothetical protein
MINKIRSKPRALFKRMLPYAANHTFSSMYFDAWVKGNAPWYYEAIHKKYPQNYNKINVANHIMMVLDSDDYFDPPGKATDEDKLITTFMVIEEFWDEILKYYQSPDAPKISEQFNSGDMMRELTFRGFIMIGYTELQVRQHYFVRSTGLAYSTVYPKICKTASRAEALLSKIGIPEFTIVNVPTEPAK